MRAINIVKVN